MNAKDLERERFFLSFLIALVLHALIFTVAAFVKPYRPEPKPVYSGPLFVELPVFRPEKTDPLEDAQVVQMAELELPAVSAPAAPARPEPPAPIPPAARTPAQPSAPAQPAVPPRGQTQTAAPARAPEQPPATSAVRGPEQPSTAAEQPAPERTGGTAGSQVIYEDEPVIASAAGSPVTATGGSVARAQETGSQTDLGALDRALAGRPAGTVETRPGEQSSGTQAARSPEVLTETQLRERRSIISYEEPKLPEGASLGGRPSVEVVVKLVITPAGLVQTAQVELPGSGDTRIDSAIQEALRKWRFLSRPGGNEEVRLRIRIEAN